MKTRLIMAAGFLAVLWMPLAAQAQGVVGGAERGAAEGNRAAGPAGAVVGGVVGGVAGGVVGGVKGVLGAPQARQPVDRSGSRIAELHDRLHITAAQEQLWSTVAQTMRDNAATLRATLADQSAKRDTMSAVDDLKIFQIIADEHSNGLKKLIPVFETLYASMTPAQQKQADRVFREHRRHSRF